MPCEETTGHGGKVGVCSGGLKARGVLVPREGGAIRDKRRAEGRDNQEPPAGLGGIETDLNGLGTERVVFLYAECDVSQGFQQAVGQVS